ncbi:hypothetical protein Q8A73_001926 [Channa argus]|nr:hypothetical protein Q8A73_001926 [Channa argus]
MGEPSLDDSNVKVAVRVRPMNRRVSCVVAVGHHVLHEKRRRRAPEWLTSNWQNGSRVSFFLSLLSGLQKQLPEDTVAVVEAGMRGIHSLSSFPFPQRNRATPCVATAKPQPIGFLAHVRAVVPNLSTGIPGRAGEKATGKWELFMEQG